MSIPLHTTTITVLRDDALPYDEPYAGPPTLTEVVTGVRAVIDVSATGIAAGQEDRAGGEQTRTVLRLICDPCDLTRLDHVRDERTLILYRVMWVILYPTRDLMEHMQGGLEVIEGLV